MDEPSSPGDPGEASRRYATILNWGEWIGLGVLVAGLAAYLSGILPSRIPLGQMPMLWRLPLPGFLAKTGAPVGWQWLAHLGEGEYASFLGIAILSGCSLFCLLAIIPSYVRCRERLYVALCVLEVAVLLLAASGIVSPHR